jgi:biopolymer transport protein ExbB/TolQ
MTCAARGGGELNSNRAPIPKRSALTVERQDDNQKNQSDDRRRSRAVREPRARVRLMEYSSISPVTMFMNAGPVGKAVMAVLILASVWTWVLIVEGIVAVVRISRAARSARAGGPAGLLAAIEAAGEHAGAFDLPGESIGEKRERVAEIMSRVGRELLTKAEGGLPNLAVISSVAPFVGLFGTVWGIMTSFAGIAQSQDTSLAVVAPGIAEALAATAYGLAAAIPASVGYNRIGAAFARAGQQVAHYVEDKALIITSGHASVARKREAA